jgi:aminotransferase
MIRDTTLFPHSSIDLSVLRQRAFNLRWAVVDKEVIPLTAADPDFPCAQEIVDEISAFVSGRYFSYGPVTGTLEFRESVSSWFRKKRNVNTPADRVLAVDSAAFGIYLICKAFLDKNDEAVIFDPVDFLFRYSIEKAGAKAVPFGIPPGDQAIDFARLESLITPSTKMLCLCNPLNPTGKVFTRDELNVLGTICRKHNLLVLSDEIWSDIVFEPSAYTSLSSLPEFYDRTIIVTGFSKSYGLAGLRIGAVLAPDKEKFERLLEASQHQSTVHGVNVVSQVAASAALNRCGEWLNAFVNHLADMRDITVSGLNAVPGFSCISPQGCYVAFANITGTGRSSSEIHEILLKKAKVAVVPGLKQWFGDGAEGYIRLSFATSAQILNEALTRIKNTISEL